MGADSTMYINVIFKVCVIVDREWLVSMWWTFIKLWLWKKNCFLPLYYFGSWMGIWDGADLCVSPDVLHELRECKRYKTVLLVLTWHKNPWHTAHKNPWKHENGYSNSFLRQTTYEYYTSTMSFAASAAANCCGWSSPHLAHQSKPWFGRYYYNLVVVI